MSGVLSKLTLNQRLAAVAFLLGALAVFGRPQQGPVSKVDAQEIAQIVQTEADQVTVGKLAGWIIEGRADYRLIDLRDEAEFEAYHIPTAERVAITDLLSYGLRRNETIVLVSGSGIRSAQAWFLMKAQDYKAVYMLTGGLTSWQNEILFPVAPAADAAAQAKADFERRVRVSSFFGGQPRAAAAGGETATAFVAPVVEMPEIQAPAVDTPAGAPAAPRKKKAREGC